MFWAVCRCCAYMWTDEHWTIWNNSESNHWHIHFGLTHLCGGDENTYATKRIPDLLTCFYYFGNKCAFAGSNNLNQSYHNFIIWILLIEIERGDIMCMFENNSKKKNECYLIFEVWRNEFSPSIHGKFIPWKSKNPISRNDMNWTESNGNDKSDEHEQWIIVIEMKPTEKQNPMNQNNLCKDD